MKTVKNFLYIVIILNTLTGCNKKTSPCFDYQQTDSLTVYFDASCSKNAYKYNWSFDNDPVVTTTPQMTYRFKTPGEHKVVLDVFNKKGKHNNGFSMEVVTDKKTIIIY